MNDLKQWYIFEILNLASPFENVGGFRNQKSENRTEWVMTLRKV